MVVPTNNVCEWCSDTKIHRDQDYDEHGFEFPTLYLCCEIDWDDWLLIYVYPLLWFISKWTYNVTDVRYTKMAARVG